MRILITGGAGCLGSNLVEHWLPAGHEILALDNFATGKREVLPDMPRLTVVEGSVADGDLMRRLFGDFSPELVVHSPPPTRTLRTGRRTYPPTFSARPFWEGGPCAPERGRRQLPGPALCYGDDRIPSRPITRRRLHRPGISKNSGEAYLLHSGLPAVSLRIANTCGSAPRHRPHTNPLTAPQRPGRMLLQRHNPRHPRQ